jgi:hypothetical protein
MSLLARIARLLLIAALIAAQQSAIAHGVWHFAAAGAAQQSSHGDGALCDQHNALGTVLGALGNANTAQQPGAQGACAVPAAAIACAPAALVAQSSRDPPSLL